MTVVLLGPKAQLDWVESRRGVKKGRGRRDTYFKKFGLKGEQRNRVVIGGAVGSAEDFEEIVRCMPVGMTQ